MTWTPQPELGFHADKATSFYPSAASASAIRSVNFMQILRTDKEYNFLFHTVSMLFDKSSDLGLTFWGRTLDARTFVLSRCVVALSDYIS